MSYTEKLSVVDKNNNKLGDIYPRAELSEKEFGEIIKNIKDKIAGSKESDLDMSIIEAHLKELLFFGKLEELDKIVKGGRGRISEFVDSLLKKMLKQGVSENDDFQSTLKEMIKNLKIDSEINDFMSKFTGKRFEEEMRRQWNEQLEIWTYSHFMTRMARAISDKFTKSENINQQQLKSTGALFFDLDGLKFLNEVNGYNAGDKALWVMARALTDDGLISWAGKMGIELVPSHHHGDEFLMGVIADDKIDLTDNTNKFTGVAGEEVSGVSLMKYIGEYVTKLVNDFGQDEMEDKEQRKELTSGQAISGSIGIVQKYTDDKRKNKINSPKSIRDIVDFSNPDQLDKLVEFRVQLPLELAALLKENFKYQLSCSYGYSTLEDAVTKNVEDGLEFDNPDVSYEYLIYKLTGKGLVDSSESKLKVAKRLGREMRRESDSLKLQLLERLYRFGRNIGGGDENFQKLYLQISQELVGMEVALEEAHKKIKSLESEVDEKNKKIRLLQSNNENTRVELGDMWKWFNNNNNNN
jgi:GGDEF domain-containing protein